MAFRFSFKLQYNFHSIFPAALASNLRLHLPVDGSRSRKEKRKKRSKAKIFLLLGVPVFKLLWCGVSVNVSFVIWQFAFVVYWLLFANVVACVLSDLCFFVRVIFWERQERLSLLMPVVLRFQHFFSYALFLVFVAELLHHSREGRRNQSILFITSWIVVWFMTILMLGKSLLSVLSPGYLESNKLWEIMRRQLLKPSLG